VFDSKHQACLVEYMLTRRKALPRARRRNPGVSSLLWRSPVGMAGIAGMLVNIEIAEPEANWTSRARFAPK